MPTCLDNIISIPDCGEQISLSGFSITDLSGLSIKRTAKVADERYMSGINLMADKRRLAILKIRNDVIAFVAGNGYQANTVKGVWQSRTKKIGGLIGAGEAGQYRGMVIYSRRSDCLLQKVYIPTVYVKTNVTGTLVLRVIDGNVIYAFPYDSIAGTTMAVDIDFTAEFREVKIMLPSDTQVYSLEPNCQCNNLPKSDCVESFGIDNNVMDKTEAYGIYADIQCKCDYTYLLCALAKQGLLGEAVLYLTGALIAEEAVSSDRLNFETLYGAEQWAVKAKEWEAVYIEKWNTLVQSLPKLLPTIDKCGCIECKTQVKANV